MIKKINKNAVRKNKHARMRKAISGTPERPRLCVFRSNAHIYAQVIDDINGNTIVSASSLSGKAEANSGSNLEAAKSVGKEIAEKAKEAGIEEVVFDRSGYIYQGRIAALADAAREAGLKF